MSNASDNTVYDSIRLLMQEQLDEAKAGLAYTHAMYQAPAEPEEPPQEPEPDVATLPESPQPADIQAAESVPTPSEQPIDEPELPHPESLDVPPAEPTEPPPPSETPQDAPGSPQPPDDLLPSLTPETPPAFPQESMGAQIAPVSEAELPSQRTVEPDEVGQIPHPIDNVGLTSTDEFPVLPDEAPIDIPPLAGEYPQTDEPLPWTISEHQPPESREPLEHTASIDEQLEKMAFAPIPTGTPTPPEQAIDDMVAMNDAIRVL